jgi:transposase
MTSPIEDLKDEYLEQLYMQEDGEEWHTQMELDGSDIAWECLSEPQKAAVMLVEVQGKTFEQAAALRGVHESTVREGHASGMGKLKEYGLARVALKEDRTCLFAVEYYQNGNDIQGLAASFGVSKSTAHRKVQDFRKKHGINT